VAHNKVQFQKDSARRNSTAASCKALKLGVMSIMGAALLARV